MNASDQTRMHQPNQRLTTACKRRFPFRLGTTSFIYPAGYVDNVRRLGAYLDEIELLLLESRPGCLPDSGTIRELTLWAQELDITYNIHLPTDLAPGSRARPERDQACRIIEQVLDLVLPLAPTVCVLHLPYQEEDRHPDTIKHWQDRIDEVLNTLLYGNDLSQWLALENLDYPLQWLTPLVEAHGLSICLDLGHLLLAGEDVAAVYQRFAAHITMIHMHGVVHGKDHIGLDLLPPLQQERYRTILQNYRGGVSLEVFNFEDLQSCLQCLTQWLAQEPI